MLRMLIHSRLNDQPPKKSGSGKKPARAPGAAKAAKPVKNPLFEPKPKNFGIGLSYFFFLDLINTLIEFL